MNMRSVVIPVLAGSLAVAATAASEVVSYEVLLDPGSFDRRSVPVTVELPLAEAHLGAEGLACRIVDRDGGRRDWRTQVERIERDETAFARVSWIQPELRGNRTATYRLDLAPAEDNDGNPRFRFEQPGEGQRDLYFGDSPVYRYVTGYDPARHEETFRTFHHLHHFGGDGFLTKGPGGLYSHHRGVFLGWNQIRDGDRTWDFWHGSDGESQRHRKHLAEREQLGAVFARAASLTDWKDPEGNLIATDTREVSAWWVDEDTRIFDFTIRLNAERPVRLDGDPHHAGFQFRASQVVADNQGSTAYVRPEKTESLADEVFAQAPWVAGLFTIRDHRYSILLVDHPDNPRPTRFSTRKYGRFGAFFTADLEPGEPLVLHYRILVKRASQTEHTSYEYFAGAHRDYVDPVRAAVKQPDP